ncbi:MAG TPA: glutamyl-tRNA reductase [Dehalococcoidia bacterium]|nr:glutamyl-tRNA reductase [Dehalococcoidia bacterium]
MSLLVLGLNHRTAPIELREKLTIDRDALGPSLKLLAAYARPGVILSTCNRLEVYAFEEAETDLPARIIAFLTAVSGVTEPELRSHLYQHQGDGCAQHLFRVASGLDSMVVGETQVLGQVRTAFSVATELGFVRGPLSGLFHQALRTARQIHRETNIGSRSRSVSQAGVQLARGLLGDLAQKQALVIGAGDAGRLVAQALSDAGVKKIMVTNRTRWRAEGLARELGGIAVPIEELSRQLAQADVVISSTGSPGYMLDQLTIREALGQRSGRPLLLIDIAVPRDIDPAVGSLDNVQLYDLDALQLMSEIAPEDLEQDLAWAEGIVEGRTEEFHQWWDSLDVIPLIASIREQAEAIRRAEVARTIGKLKGRMPDDLEELASRLDAMTNALVKKLLHHSTVHFKENRGPAQQELARQLFNLAGNPDRNRGGGRQRRGRQ